MKRKRGQQRQQRKTKPDFVITSLSSLSPLQSLYSRKSLAFGKRTTLLHATRLESHKAREEDVVLDVDMLKEPIHEDLKIGKHKAIGGTRVLGSNKILHENTYKLIACALVAMLAVHDTYWVCHAATVHTLVCLATHICLDERVAIGKQHLLLLLEVVFKVLERLRKERLKLM